MTRVEQILTKLGIEYRAKGPRLWALCPFHEDSHESWFIRPAGERAGQHHCFVCKNGGGLVDLVMHRRGYASPQSAINWLEDFKEAPPPPVKTITFQVQPIQKKRFRLPKEVRLEPLERWPALPRRYVESRGLADQITRWHIGYAVDSRLAGRIVFPVWTRANDQLIPWSYQARTFVDHEQRYFFPFESDGANLDVMYGALHWPMFSIRKKSRVYVTEGCINALAIERVIEKTEYVGALGASDVREGHVGILATFAEVIIVTDPDKSGNAAADALTAALVRHTRVGRVLFPSKKVDFIDPGGVKKKKIIKLSDPASVSPQELRRILSLVAFV